MVKNQIEEFDDEDELLGLEEVEDFTEFDEDQELD